MNTFTNRVDPLSYYDWHVLVLHDGVEKDILGIWGPYTSESNAELALEELKKWPLDGSWSVFELKQFRSSLSQLNLTNVRGVQVGDGGTQHNVWP